MDKFKIKRIDAQKVQLFVWLAYINNTFFSEKKVK